MYILQTRINWHIIIGEDSRTALRLLRIYRSVLFCKSETTFHREGVLSFRDVINKEGQIEKKMV